MSSWSNCDIRLIVALAFSFALMLMSVVYVMIRVYDKLEQIERLVIMSKKSDPNQKECPNSDNGKANHG